MEAKENKKTKQLVFHLTMKEYSDFWYVGELLNLTRKKDILNGAIDFVKKFKERHA